MIAYDASGGRLAAPAWADFYNQGWTEPVAANAWAPPPGMVAAVIDPTTGWLANEWCPARKTEYFKPNNVPTTLCIEHGAPEESYPANWPDQTSWPQDIGHNVDRLGKKIGKALGKIFKF